MKDASSQQLHRDDSVDRFGYSWERFDRLTDQQEAQFQRWTPFFDPAADWKGKTFLDAGCGAGRNSVWAMKYGADRGVAIDLDDRSLAAAKRNLADAPSVEVRKQSIYEVEEKDVFDVCFSIGVIHHLADPDLGLARLTRAAKPSGKVLIWVYGRENMGFYVNVMNPLRRVFFSRLPLSFVRWLSLCPTAIIWALLRCGYRPNDYWAMISGFSFSHLRHIMFDQMLPKIANYWRQDEAEGLLKRAGLHDVRSHWVNQISWAVVGTKPNG